MLLKALVNQKLTMPSIARAMRSAKHQPKAQQSASCSRTPNEDDIKRIQMQDALAKWTALSKKIQAFKNNDPTSNI